MVGGPSTLNKMDPWEEFLLFSVILPMANAGTNTNQHRQEAACEAAIANIRLRSAAARRRLSSRSTATTGNLPIVRNTQQRLNDTAAGSIGNHHGVIHLQVLQFERGTFNEPLPPIGCNAFPTVDYPATSAGALKHSVRTVHPNNLIDTGSAVSIQPIHRDGHRVTGCHSPYLLAMNAAQVNQRV